MLCSFFQVYGKGTGKACRKHVQKLNMLQGEREKKEESGGGNHPPCDYANTFTAQSAGPARPRETQVGCCGHSVCFVVVFLHGQPNATTVEPQHKLDSYFIMIFIAILGVRYTDEFSGLGLVGLYLFPKPLLLPAGQASSGTR